MKVSVIVPALNEENYIGVCLGSLAKQNFKDFELIVVDGYSGDRTRDIARRYKARVFLQKPRGFARAKNLGASKAKGEILAFTDADTFLPEWWLERIVGHFRDPRVVAVAGPLAPFPSGLKHELVFGFCANLLPRVTSLLKFYQFHSPNIGVRRKTFLEAGGFNPQLELLDDNELGNRLKKFGKVVWDHKLVVLTSPRRWEKGGYLKETLELLRGYLDLYLLRKGRTKYSRGYRAFR